MKTMLVLAVALIAVSVAAFAQQGTGSVDGVTIPYEPQINLPIAEPSAPSSSAALEPQGYYWAFPILPNPGDSSRFDINIPNLFGDGTEFRGIGQIFSPSYMYNIYNGRPYTESSNIRYDGTDQITDQTYIDQFKDAAQFSVDSLQTWFYKNPYNLPLYPAKFSILRATIDPTSAAWKKASQGGLWGVARNTLEVAYEEELTTSELDATIYDSGGNLLIRPDTIRFPDLLVGDKGESFIFLYTNDQAPATPVGVRSDTNQREWQSIIANWEYRGGTLLAPQDSIQNWQSLGVVMYRSGGNDALFSAFSNLIYTFTPPTGGQTNRAAKINLRMQIWGSVEIQAGVKYHYGTDVSSQGLGNVAPNPVQSGGRVPFSLTEISHVTVDLYSVGGEHIKTLIDNKKYIPGAYSVALPDNELTNGTYLVRMSANDNVYTMKFNVAR